ncbi:MAG: ribosomal protein S18-alanine N-acetyltransferase [Deltaproteobacteria bacterium]|nr:ribosomal protein S18-alanine N-acetyltransferase [Deltaproteobacteria bacterium]
MSPADSCEIRPATPADLDALAGLEDLSFANPWSRESLAGELENPSSIFLLLETIPTRQPVAYACARIIPPEAELLRIAVTPRLRRQHLGFLLLEHLVTLLRRQKIESLHLEVSENNLPARKLYSRLDFTRTGRRPGYYDQGRTAALLLSRKIL